MRGRPQIRPKTCVVDYAHDARTYGVCARCRRPTGHVQSSSRSVLLFQQGLAEKGDDLIHRASCGLARRIYQVESKD
jgi:hypothetical protein